MSTTRKIEQEQTTLPPLVSARLFDILRSIDGNVAEWVTDDLLSIHDDLVKEEADRTKTREVVQILFDALHAIMEAHGPGTLATDAIYQGAVTSLNLAKSQLQIEPKP